ncbi:hypothetical protein SDC9_104888 [bioreactor metagenome]|uniref:Uncharacterized protein n=1 Tax=bioreactor metagenome TaxID=1076179 RepID=A0A645AY55_9ZZZZ
MNKLSKLREFLRKLFWIDKLEGKNKFLTFAAKLYMYFYITVIPIFLIFAVLSFNLGNVVSACLLVVIYPIVYRMIMGFQRLVHKI